MLFYVELTWNDSFSWCYQASARHAKTLCRTKPIVQSLKLNEFAQDQLPLPLAEQHRIVARVEASFDLCVALEAKLKSA